MSISNINSFSVSTTSLPLQKSQTAQAVTSTSAATTSSVAIPVLTEQLKTLQISSGTFSSSATSLQKEEITVEVQKELTLSGLKQLAEKGDPRAQYLYAQRYENQCGGLHYKLVYELHHMCSDSEFGPSPKETENEVLKWYTKSAEQGYAPAQLLLGKRYSDVYADKKNYSDAFKWLKLAADQGNAEAQYELGFLYYIHNNFLHEEMKLDPVQCKKDAVEWFEKSAKQGNHDAQNRLGVCYEKGIGIAKDPKQAAQWYAKAAEGQDSDAWYNLGRCYQDGIGVEIDLAKAVEWYTKAAKEKNPNAQYSLGLCYEKGTGVAQDIPKAIKLYEEVAKYPSDELKEKAYGRLADIFGKGIGVPQDSKKAALYQEEIDDLNDWGLDY